MLYDETTVGSIEIRELILILLQYTTGMKASDCRGGLQLNLQNIFPCAQLFIKAYVPGLYPENRAMGPE